MFGLRVIDMLLDALDEDVATFVGSVEDGPAARAVVADDESVEVEALLVLILSLFAVLLPPAFVLFARDVEGLEAGV